MLNGIFVTVGNVVMMWLQRSERWCHPVQRCVSPVSECLLWCFRFILVFSCLVLSVFSTIPAHQDFSSDCLLILVRYKTRLYICLKQKLKTPVNPWNHDVNKYLQTLLANYVISVISALLNLHKRKQLCKHLLWLKHFLHHLSNDLDKNVTIDSNIQTCSDSRELLNICWPWPQDRKICFYFAWF